MSNPYDPNSSPYGGSDPSGGAGGYGAPQGGGQGGGGYGTPYGQSDPYGNNAPKKTDAVSIIAFILSLTCCLSIVGAIMGFIGLGRTKGGQRKGRWAAITATVLGILGTLAFAGGIIFIVFLAKSTITPDNAKVGECANVSTSGGNISLLEKDCDSSHDAEIVAVDDYGNLDPTLVPSSIDDITDSAISQANCASLMDDADVATLGDGYEWTLALEDPNNPADSDKLICFVESANGDKLDAPLLN